MSAKSCAHCPHATLSYDDGFWQTHLNQKKTCGIDRVKYFQNFTKISKEKYLVVAEKSHFLDLNISSQNPLKSLRPDSCSFGAKTVPDHQKLYSHYLLMGFVTNFKLTVLRDY